jgi:sugar lactone lactonase YvrE
MRKGCQVGNINVRHETCDVRHVMCDIRFAIGSVILCLLIGLAGCGQQGQTSLGSATTTTTLPPPPPAGLVLGQVDFVHNGPSNPVDAMSLDTPKGVAVDTNNNLFYIADTENNRVLGYMNLSTLLSGAPADIVVGQADMNSNLCDKGNIDSDGLPVPDGTTLCGPRGVAVDSAGNLYVADTGNNRVLEFDTPLSGTPPGPGDTIADHVFGQSNSFTTIATGISTQPMVEANLCNNVLALGVSGLSDKSLCVPVGIALDSHDNLYVADAGNHRVLEYETPLKIALSGMSTGSNSNDVTTQTGTLNDTTRVEPLAFAPNQFVNFIVEITSGTGGGQVRTIVSNGTNQLVVTPPWTTIPPINAPYRMRYGTAADHVFGQGDLFNINGCNNTASVAGGLGAKSLCFPEAIALDGAGDLYVADTLNNRVSEYDTPIAIVASGTSTSPPANTSTTLNDTAKSFTPNQFVNFLVEITSGPGVGQMRTIFSNTDKQLTVSSSWATIPNPGDTYQISKVVDTTAARVFGQGGSFDFSSDLDINGNPLPANRCNNPAPEVGGLSSKSLCLPEGVAVDSAGNLYVSDTRNSRVLEYDNPLGNSPPGICPTCDTIADSVFGQPDFTSVLCNNSAATIGGLGDKSLCFPVGVVLDNPASPTPIHLYVVDTRNNRVLRFP